MVLIHVTYPDEEEAKKISKLIIEKELAIAVDLSRINSVYANSDELKIQPGVALLIKTLETKVQEIENLIRGHNHHHIPPCIAVIELFRVNREYKEWLQTHIH